MRKITFEQLSNLADVVDLVDCDGYAFVPDSGSESDEHYGTAEYDPAADGWILFHKDEENPLEILLREDGVTLVNQDPGGNGDLVLHFKFSAAYVVGWDPYNKLAPLGERVYGVWDHYNAERHKIMCDRQDEGWFTEEGKCPCPPLRWYPVWETVRDRALDGIE